MKPGLIMNQNPKDNPWNGNTHPLLPKKKKIQVGTLCEKTYVLGYEWPILEHYQEKGETVNSVRYSAMLEEKLKPAIHSRHHGLLSKGIPLHDNA
jgi:hypothetical protein